MAVAFDAVGPSAVAQSGTALTSLTWSHTAAGSNLCVVVGCVAAHPGGNQTSLTMTATYGGVTMTSLGTLMSGATSLTARLQMWYLKAPATGAQNVVVTASAATNDMIGGSTSFTGVDQTTPVGTPVTANGDNATAFSINVPGTSVGNAVVDCMCHGTGGGSSTQTARWKKDLNVSSAGGNGYGSSAAGTGGTVAMGYTGMSTVDSYALIAVELKAAATVRVPPAIQPYTARRRASLF